MTECPLGSGALAGTNLNTTKTTKLPGKTATNTGVNELTGGPGGTMLGP